MRDELLVKGRTVETRSAARVGFDRGPVPGAADPANVAREALDALGNKAVHIAGLLSQATFGPFLVPLRIVTGTLASAMRYFRVSRS